MSAVNVFLTVLASINIVLSFINTFHSKDKFGWFCSTMGWSVALLWIVTS